MLDLDVAGRAIVTENGIEIVSAPEGVTFEPLPADYASKLIPDDDKFAMREPRRWEHGLLVHVPKGVELEKPLYVQVDLDRRHALLAHGRDRRRGRALLADRGPLVGRRRHVVAYTNAVVELFVEPQAKIEYVSLQNLSQRDLALRPPQGVARARQRARLGARRLRLEARQGLDRERPRRRGRHLARHRRVLRRRRPAPRLRHVPGAHRAEHRERLRVQGRAARAARRRSGAG